MPVVLPGTLEKRIALLQDRVQTASRDAIQRIVRDGEEFPERLPRHARRLRRTLTLQLGRLRKEAEAVDAEDAREELRLLEALHEHVRGLSEYRAGRRGWARKNPAR